MVRCRSGGKPALVRGKEWLISGSDCETGGTRTRAGKGLSSKFMIR